MEGRFNGGFFALPVWGAYTWRGLFSEFLRYLVTQYVIYNMVYIQMYHRATRVHTEHLSSVSSVCVFAAQSFVAFCLEH